MKHRRPTHKEENNSINIVLSCSTDSLHVNSAV